MRLIGDLQRQLQIIDYEADDLLRRSSALLDETKQSFRNSSSPVGFQSRSANSKLSRQRIEIASSGRKRYVPIGPFVSSTYVSIEATCPPSCRFKEGGCFAKAGSTHLTMSGLDRAALGLTALQVSLAEAAAIDAAMRRGIPQDGARGGRDLRLHVGGEVSCTAGARALAGAAERWKSRGGGAVWSFTHRWAQISRDAWGPISVLASCETHEDVVAAVARGFVPAIVVPEFPSGPRAFYFAGRKTIPCPAEASERVEGGPTCSSCRLCLDDRKLFELGLAIGFSAHGRDEEDASNVVPVRNLTRDRVAMRSSSVDER